MTDFDEELILLIFCTKNLLKIGLQRPCLKFIIFFRFWQFVEGEMFRKAIVICLLIPYTNYTINKAVKCTSIIMFGDAIEYIYAFFEVVDLEILILQISYLIITQTHKLNIFDLNALLGL